MSIPFRARSIWGAAGLTLCLALSAFSGQKIRFSNSWKFYRGDASGGAQGRDYNDDTWATVHLPHTVREELNYRTSSIYMGICWYRKTFTLPESYRGKKIFVEFEAAMQSAQLWFNGVSLITHLGGYTPFVVDITSHLQFGSVNVIAVRLDNNPSTSFPPGNSNPDFLYFGGLYRDVHLLVTDSLHITHPVFANIPGGGGVFVTYPSVSSSSATVQVKTHVRNERAAAQSCVVATTILDARGTTVAANSTAAANIASGASNTFTQSLSIASPKLWTPNTPNLYIVKSQVFRNGGSDPVDTMSTTIGIRSIAFSKANGLQINGTRYRLHGCNRHMSYPYIGNAVPASGQYRDALRIKEYGFDFVRMSHYMQPECFVDACDKLGIASMACLPGWQYFTDTQAFRDNSIKALRDMIRVYRNHPSVIVYEAMHNESVPSSAYLKAAQAAAHEEYPGNQMFTCGEEEGNILDVYISSAQHGVRNYTGSRACIISEYGDWEHGCVWSDVNPITGCQCRIERSAGEAALRTVATTRANDIKLNEVCSWFSVDGVWTIFDYQSWNRGPYTASGDMDIFRIPKYASYVSQGKSAAAWEWAGSSQGIKVTIDTADLKFRADGSDIAIVYASNVNSDVTFSVSGPGSLVGKNPAEAIAGIASILLRAGTMEGRITVSASAGSSSGSATVTSHAENELTAAVAYQSISSATAGGVVTDFLVCRTGNGITLRIQSGAGTAAAAMEFTLCDALGRTAGRWTIDRSGLTIPVGSLPGGIYFGLLRCGPERSIRKMVW